MDLSNYGVPHLCRLRQLVQANGDAVCKHALEDYVRRVVVHYHDMGVFPCRAMKEVLILARTINPAALRMQDLLDLAYYSPRLGAPVLLKLAASSAERDVLIAHRKDIIGIFDTHRGGGSVRMLMRAMSAHAPRCMASMFALRGKWCTLVSYVTPTCMWHMVDYIKSHVDHDNTAAELMMQDDIGRAVDCGIFTRACILGDAKWPAAAQAGDLRYLHGLLYNMATTGEVGAANAHLFSRVDAMEPNYLRQLLGHPRCPRLLACDIKRTRSWLRRRAWMCALVKLQARQVGGQRKSIVSAQLRAVACIRPISQMIMAFV